MDATLSARATLRDLKADPEQKPVFDAIAERVQALRGDPGDPAIRGSLFRMIRGHTVRVVVLYVPAVREEWSFAWELGAHPDDKLVFRILHVERIS